MLEWSPQSPDLSPLDYYNNSMLKTKVRKLVGAPAKPDDVRTAALQVISELPEQEVVDAIN